MLVPTFSWVVVKPEEEDKKEKVSKGGIVLISTEEKYPTKHGTIVAIGPKVENPIFEVGSRVGYYFRNGLEMIDPTDGEKYVFLKDDGIMAVLKK
jgi:co-chaperonin GroES (HSP10)